MTVSEIPAASLPEGVRVSELAGGLRVATDAMDHLETASVGVWVDVGARYEDSAVNGVSHLLEHMAFKGTERRSARDIAEEIEAVGGHLNAYTSREHTAYFARVLKDDVPLAVDILADILQHSTFAEEELAREREVIVQEIGQAEDTPDDVVFDRFQEAAYPDQALGRSILGTVERVTSMSREDLRGYMAAHYGAASMVVAAAGRVDHDRLVDLVGAGLDGLPASAGPGPAPARYAAGEFRESRDLEQVHLLIGFDGLAHGDDRFYACHVLSTLLGGGMSSRLFQEVRENRGLAYAVHSFSASYSDGGLFGIYAGTGPAQLEELMDVAAGEICKVTDDVGEDELVRARSQLKAGLMMSLESSSSRCEQLGRQMHIFGRPLPLGEIVAAIDSVTRDDAAAVADRLFRGGRPVVAALGPIDQLEPYPHIASRFAREQTGSGTA